MLGFKQAEQRTNLINKGVRSVWHVGPSVDALQEGLLRSKDKAAK